MVAFFGTSMGTGPHTAGKGPGSVDGMHAWDRAADGMAVPDQKK